MTAGLGAGAGLGATRIFIAIHGIAGQVSFYDVVGQ